MRISYKTFITFLFLITFSVVSGQTSLLRNKYVLVIDMQEYGTKHVLESGYAQNLIDKINQVILQADTDKVIYVEAIMAKLGVSLTKLTVNFEPGLALDDRLVKVGDKRIVKTQANSFTSEHLQNIVKETGATDFVLVGLMAEHCVKATALGGLNEGYSITVIPDAIAGESEESLSKTLAELEKAGVKILTLKELN